MTTPDVIRTEDAFQIPTYHKFPLALVRGEGVYVWDADGKRYLDFYGGHCVTLLGHCPPRVVEAIREQAGTLLFYSNAAYSPVRARAAALLAAFAPEGLGHAFFCNSGTEANETALKLARKWTGKPHVVAMTDGFHGRTLGSLAATSNPKYRAPYADVLPETTFVPFGDAEAVADVLAARDDVAAVILEPIQSMAGITEAPPAYFQTLRRLCDAHGAALIFDEVQTGVGRTGAFSISEHFGMTPDLITLAKSLGSGVPVGAVLASDAVAATVRHGDQGSTFGGGMLAMAAMTATLETIRDEALMTRASRIFERIAGALRPHVKAVRGRGCLLGVELHGPAAPVLAKLRAAGVLAGSAAHPNVIRLMPPLNTPDEAVDAFLTAFTDLLATHDSVASYCVNEATLRIAEHEPSPNFKLNLQTHAPSPRLASARRCDVERPARSGRGAPSRRKNVDRERARKEPRDALLQPLAAHAHVDGAGRRPPRRARHHDHARAGHVGLRVGRRRGDGRRGGRAHPRGRRRALAVL